MDAVIVQWYNHQHKHSGLKFVTPAQRHDGRDASILSPQGRLRSRKTAPS